MHASRLSRRHLFQLAAGSVALTAAPKRGMIVRSSRADDVEMPLDGFLESYITPIDRFFVRSHHYVPTVDPAAWRLQVNGKVATPLTLTMDELKKLPRVELVSVLECAGSREPTCGELCDAAVERCLYAHNGVVDTVVPVLGPQWNRTATRSEYALIALSLCAMAIAPTYAW